MRILGIDPGSRLTGFGVIEISGDRAIAVRHGVIRTGEGEFPQRIGVIFQRICDVIDELQPAEVAIETVFVSRNASSALKLGQARGAALCAAVSRELPVAEYSPRSIKQAMVGRGGADKTQVQHMVSVLLGLETSPEEDAADALAVALCHQHTRQTTRRMQALQQK
jgi:crossover junction endodeoxyribonuclease RuvC